MINLFLFETAKGKIMAYNRIVTVLSEFPNGFRSSSITLNNVCVHMLQVKRNTFSILILTGLFRYIFEFEINGSKSIKNICAYKSD